MTPTILVEKPSLHFFEPDAKSVVLFQVTSNQLAYRSIDDLGPVRFQSFAIDVQLEGEGLVDVQGEVFGLSGPRGLNRSRHG